MRRPPCNAITLGQRNIYILPTRAGWMFLATLTLLLIGAINYQLSLGYVLTFLLAGAGASAMVVGHGTLRGLQLTLVPPEPVFAGNPATLKVQLHNARRQPRLAIGLAPQAQRDWSWIDVAGHGSATLDLSIATSQRGLHMLPRLRIEVRYPMGIFRVWSIWQPQAKILVYPAPETPAPPLPPGPPSAGRGVATPTRDAGEFDGVRPYRRGDPSRLIVWKKWAQSGTPVSRDTARAQSHILWLERAATQLADPEAQLARLTAWVLAADAAGLAYGLRLSGTRMAPDAGAQQRQRCLRALALA